MGFLVCEIIQWEAQYDRPLVSILLIKRFQIFVLISKFALNGGIDQGD